MSLKITDLTTTVRLQGWWKAKAANLLAVLYSVTLITALPLTQALLLLAAALVTIIGIGGFGHVINDVSDISVDASAGKPNPMAHLSPWQRLSLVGVVLAIALLPWLVLPSDRLTIALLLIEFSLLLAYAIPPLRLKQRGIWAMLTDAAYAYALPALLAAHTFFLAAGRPDNRALAASLFVWQTALGTRHFLNHLALDRANDICSGVSTLATIKGSRYIHTLIRHAILPIELLGFLSYLLVMNEYARLLPYVIAAIFTLISSVHIVLAIGRSYPFLTYRFSKTQLDWLYQVVLPLVLLSYLVRLDLRFSVLLFAHVLLFALLARAFRPPRPLSLQPAAAGIPSGRSHRQASSAIGGATGLLAQPTNSKRQAGASRVNIAVVNINKGKYTETFVRGLVSRLQYNISYLHGDDLPRFDNDDRHFLSSWPSLQALVQFLETVLRLEKNTFLKSSIRSYLQGKNTRLLLAEFGPVGNQMLPITRDLGIPLIIYFHGYDVFNRQALQQYSARYPDLFREAACIIGVSETMLSRLEELGAPREKLLHLPAFVNLELFPYSDHGATPPRFLAVGRFAETKSPHLTLLAFHEVSKVFPEARLTMIGKGGGGELFEACLILARALGLENRVEFKGVVNHEGVAAEMRLARVFVQHSVTTPEHGDMEGKPVAIMEAMASGLPVVATRHSGISELIEDGVTGLLVEEYDVAAMAAAMIRLAQDDNLVRQIGERASAFIHNHPLISRHVEIMEGIIDRTIADS
jgi:colanic acid/amylovoran biosynthesis glycosyltransferase